MSDKIDESPLVSILMTSYNNELYIGEAIESIINQTYQNWELLVADDCSSDRTRSTIDSYSDERIKTFHNNANLHYLRTRNKLVQYVKGDYITLLDADDLCSKERIQLQLNAFLEDKNLALCGTLVAFINSNGQLLNIDDDKPLTYDQIKKQIKSKNVFTGSTIMVKTSVWNEFNGYRDYFSSFGYEDYDLTSRISEKYKTINLPQKLYSYRQYPESFTKNDLLTNPFKLLGYKLVQQFILQRQQKGSDKLMENDIPWIINFILKENTPYIKDSTLIYRNLAWSNFNRKLPAKSITYCLKAIATKPLVFLNYKLLLNLLLILAKLKKA